MSRELIDRQKNEKDIYILDLFNKGIYSCDKNGNIYSHVNTQGNKKNKSHKLRVYKNKNNYCLIRLCLSGKQVNVFLHRAIFLFFNGEIRHQINHKNGIKTDNRLSNLEDVTRSENIKHAFNNGLMSALKGVENGNSKLNGSTIKKIFNLRIMGLSQSEIANKFNTTQANIGMILRRKKWNHVKINKKK